MFPASRAYVAKQPIARAVQTKERTLTIKNIQAHRSVLGKQNKINKTGRKRKGSVVVFTEVTPLALAATS